MDLLGLEFQTVESLHVGTGNLRGSSAITFALNSSTLSAASKVPLLKAVATSQETFELQVLYGKCEV